MDYVTRDDLRTALEPFATRAEMQAEFREVRTAFAACPTRDEMQEAIRAAMAPLATREEMREEGDRTRRHFDVVAESLRSDIRVIAEGYAAPDQKIEKVRLEQSRE